MSRNAMKTSLAITIIGVLLLGYTNCSNPKYTDSGESPYGSNGSVDDSNALKISPSGKTVNWGETILLSVAGGTPPYYYRLNSGGGSLSSSGVYTAPAANTTAIIDVTDAAGAVTQASVNVNINSSSSITLSYSPSGAIALNTSVTLSAAGGTAPYTYAMYSGPGTISGNVFYGASFGNAVVAVRDASGAVATFNLAVGSQINAASRVIYRLYHSSAKQYLFSQTTTEGTSSGFVNEGAAFKVLTASYLSTAALMRCYIASSGGRYLTSAGNCGSYTNEGTLGYVYTYAAPNTVRLYNCFKSSTGTYLASTDYSVCVNNGYNVTDTLGYLPQ